jgi:hypothetical protein
LQWDVRHTATLQKAWPKRSCKSFLLINHEQIETFPAPLKEKWKVFK